jgi:hypothetical protein
VLWDLINLLECCGSSSQWYVKIFVGRSRSVRFKKLLGVEGFRSSELFCFFFSTIDGEVDVDETLLLVTVLRRERRRRL